MDDDMNLLKENFSTKQEELKMDLDNYLLKRALLNNQKETDSDSAKFWFTLIDGKTSYEISEEDYNQLKEFIGLPEENVNRPRTFDLKEKKHDKKENVWVIRTIIVSNILSLNRHEPKEIEEPKNRAILIANEYNNVQECIDKNVIRVTEKDYKNLKDAVANNKPIEAGCHGIPENTQACHGQIYFLDNPR